MSLETFFGGHLSVLARAGQVQDTFAERFDSLFVPNVNPGEPLALRPYQLRPRGQHEPLAIAVNQATYVSFRYPGHCVFLDTATDVLASTLEILGIERLERVVYRYENEMALQRVGSGAVALSDIFRLTFPDGPGDGLTSFDMDWTRQWPQGLAGTRIWLEDDAGVCLLRWTLTATVVPAGPSASLREYATAAHEHASQCFEQLITDKFRQFLRTEEQEHDDV